jgi:hypothetical protein
MWVDVLEGMHCKFSSACFRHMGKHSANMLSIFPSFHLEAIEGNRLPSIYGSRSRPTNDLLLHQFHRCADLCNPNILYAITSANALL